MGTLYWLEYNQIRFYIKKLPEKDLFSFIFECSFQVKDGLYSSLYRN